MKRTIIFPFTYSQMAMLPFVNNETCVCELVVIPACHHVDMKIGELDNRIDERKINIYNSVKSISDIGNVDYFIMTEGDSSDAALQFAVEQAVILAEKGCRIHCLFDIEKKCNYFNNSKLLKQMIVKDFIPKQKSNFNKDSLLYLRNVSILHLLRHINFR